MADSKKQDRLKKLAAMDDNADLMQLLAQAGIQTSEPVPTIQRISTGSLMLDYVTGGGFGRGRSHIYWGSEGTGKTTLLLAALKSALDNGLRVALFRTEYNTDPRRFKQMGIDMSKVAFFGDPGMIGEELQDILSDLIEVSFARKQAGKRPLFDLIAWDSLAATAFRAQIEATAEDNIYAVGARQWDKFFIKNSSRLAGTDTALLFVQQARDNQNKGSNPNAPKEIMPGARRIKHDISMKVQFKAALPVKTGETIKGYQFVVAVQKNHLGTAGQKAEIEMEINPSTNETSMSFLKDMPFVAQQLGVFTKKDGVPSYDGNSKFFDGQPLGANKDEIIKVLQINDDLYDSVYFAIKEAFQREAAKAASGELTVLDNIEEVDDDAE